MSESSTIKTITAQKKLKVFSGSINPKLAQGIADAIGIELGQFDQCLKRLHRINGSAVEGQDDIAAAHPRACGR